MKTVFAFLIGVAFCMNVYAGCPNGKCALKNAPANTSVYTVSPAASNTTSTSKVVKPTKTRSYRVSKWR